MRLVVVVGFFHLSSVWCARTPAVLVVSFDGFRYDYFEKKVTPFLDQLKNEGTHAEYMRNVFPTKTYPNHHSMATGVYAEVHGVLHSKVYDPVSKKLLEPYDLFHYDKRVVPIWAVNEQSPGTGRHSGVMMWPSGDVEFYGRLPTFLQSYNYSVPWEERVDTVIGWLTHPNTPANLVFMYLEDPDRHSHVFGAESPQTLEQIQRADNITRYLYNSLKKSNLMESVNVFLVSDHGMDTVTKDRIIDLRSVLDKYGVMQVGSSPVVHLIPTSATEDQVYRELKNLSSHLPFNVYRKAELPERWHVRKNVRTPPLLLVANETYAFHDMYDSETYYRKKWNIPDDVEMTFGVHGYDPAEEKMRPFFLAWGPNIRKNYFIPPFDNIDLYPLISQLLNIKQVSTNGTIDHVKSMLTASASPVLMVNVWLLLSCQLL